MLPLSWESKFHLDPNKNPSGVLWLNPRKTSGFHFPEGNGETDSAQDHTRVGESSTGEWQGLGFAPEVIFVRRFWKIPQWDGPNISFQLMGLEGRAGPVPQEGQAG